jgi:hypothetical protein
VVYEGLREDKAARDVRDAELHQIEFFLFITG